MDGFWGPCAIALIALGLNKQLDAQTTLIRVLRTLSREGGWYGVRRAVEAAGFALLLLASLGAAALAWRRRKRWRRDGARPWAMAGFGLLALYVLLRAGNILHVGRQAPALIETAHALIEPAGLLLVLAGAARAIRRGAETSRAAPDGDAR